MEGEGGRLHISKGDTLRDITIDNDKDGSGGSNRAGTEKNSYKNKGKEVCDFWTCSREAHYEDGKEFPSKAHDP